MKELQSLDEVFNKKIFRIPDYQRGYAWGEKQLIEFWEDLLSLDSHRSHYTGVLSIKKVPENIWSRWNDEKWLIEGRRYIPYFIVDGQQRLTTVSILIQCLIEAVTSNPANERSNKADIFLGAYKLSEIIEKYIAITEPRHRTINTYKFGYEVDNPSFDFLRHQIFGEPNAGTIRETFYTLNLENAKNFFKENIAKLIKQQGFNLLEEIYEKLTQRFLFNLYEIDDNFDVFVAFETMNNRGKRLSDLELLKNRLIYLTTLYPLEEVADDIKENIRTKINKTWGEIYNQLGRNKKTPLNDDDFLRAHWIMYFKYSRNKGNDYIRYLLDDYFSPKNIFEKLEVSTSGIENVEELTDSPDSDDDEVIEQVPIMSRQSKLKIIDISKYVDSLKESSKIWYSTFFPSDSEELSESEQIAMDRINRVKIAYFRPLIMAALIRTKPNENERISLLNQIERFIFISFRLCRAQSTYRSSAYYRDTRSIYMGEISIPDVIASLNNDLSWVFDKNNIFKTSYFRDFISRKFGPNGDGFYGWNDLSYFLFEYEERIKESRNQPKLGWHNFTKSETDKVSIEHIYPQTADSEYWITRFTRFSDDECRYLRGSLGNLLPLSSSINSSLQNDDFPNKKKIKTDDNGEVIRNGYANGSYSELEVAKNEDWTEIEILERGLTLLKFMEERWQISLGTCSNKLELLHLSFLDMTNNISTPVIAENQQL
ncbi:MAG: DUF262 domain-containing protein [Burkholderiales bacterium]|nr:DUF262 domain-containing protein [Burkholderiales bacterium]